MDKGGRTYNKEFITCKYFVAVDFEATCIEENGPNYPHEIIEFPAVLVDLTTGERVATFHSFVRPRINPVLSDFCKKLTGISQELGMINFLFFCGLLTIVCSGLIEITRLPGYFVFDA